MAVNNSKTENRDLSEDNFVSVVIVLLGVAIVIAALITAMIQSVRQSNYAERKAMLANLTEASAKVIDDNVEFVSSLTDIITGDAQRNLADYPTIEEYMAAVSGTSGYSSQPYFFVDTDGLYYCSDGASGKLSDLTYYTDSSEERLSYISTLPHLDTEKEYLIFRDRFSKPITTASRGSEARVVYCGVLYDIDVLKDTLSTEFAGDNNTFIYDTDTGAMLYKNFGIKLLIDGFNIYPKLSAAQIVFGEDPEQLEQACRNGETVVMAMLIGGEEYYFCSAALDRNDWSVAFVVQTTYLDEISGNAHNKIILYIGLIALALSAAVVVAVSLYYKNTVSKKSLLEIKELNAELSTATQAKSDFLSNMSHDIRTPINGIMGMTQIAKNVEGNPEKTKDCLNKIDEASGHLLSLINDVLDMTRIERGATEIANKSMDLLALCRHCADIIKGQLVGRELNVITDFNCTHTAVIGDDLHLRQVLINILGNAVKFTKDGGTIKFSCTELSSDDTEAVYSLKVEDTGIGMKKEFIPKIFDSFSQDEGGARSNYKGTGLGMTISKKLTEMMGGTIEVESEEGKGSIFTVTLPFKIDTGAREAEAQDDADASIEGFKILLAEDNELNTEIAVELLGSAGAEITTAENGEEALNLFSGSAPGTFDVILMDIMMPRMNGLEATKAIRALHREDAGTIPIIAMTSNAFESDVKATKEAGMNAHLSKPIEIKHVISTVAHYVRKQRENT